MEPSFSKTVPVEAVVVLVALAQVAESRGGRGIRLSRGGGGGGGGFFFLGGLGGGGETYVIVIAIVILLLFCCAMASSSRSEDGDKDEYAGCAGPRTQCYLCLADIPEEPWNDRSHRRNCAAQNAAELASFPEPYPVHCPKCGSTLKQWPAKGGKFYCEVNGCTHSGPIENTGFNRFNCFICNYDRFNCFICNYDQCIQCVKREVESRATNPFSPPAPSAPPLENNPFFDDANNPPPSYENAVGQSYV